MQSMSITINVVSSNQAKCIRYIILCYRFSVTCGRSVVSPGIQVSSTNKTDRIDIAEIFLKIAFSITLTPTHLVLKCS